MKHFFAGYGIATIIAAIVAWLYAALFWPSDACLQQQAGYQAVVTTQTALLQRKTDLLDMERGRLAVLQAAHAALQQELAVRMAQSVVIPEPKAIPVSQLEPIDQLAARMAPVEAKVKEVAQDNHEFIPAGLRDYWSKVKANPSLAEQLVGKFVTRGK